MNNLSAGQRVTVRSEDFLVSNVNVNHDGSLLLHAEGISELVKGKRFVFDTRLDPVTPLLPSDTLLIPDFESGYRKTKLFIETQIRNTSIDAAKISVAYKGAFNTAEYQLTPTLQALELPRPRLLIADGVGLGKTIEVGIFLAEMIRRGRGKRIMVLALKSILGQFQQELWSRFAIPLIRLDSEGIDRVKSQLPSNKNPFEYYDKTIISIDTLKNNAKFRHYIEKTRWDIIVIDECHTVANTGSQRGGLAHLLANRCESLILTSATPHNGRRETFANLIRMIEPTAIARTGDYTREAIAPYYVRRFKHNIEDDAVRANFQDRRIMRTETTLLPEEMDFLEYQQSLKFEAIRRNTSGKPSPDFLFATSVFKAYMSSPAAALATVERRLQKIKAKLSSGEGFENDKDILETLQGKLQHILKSGADSKYIKLRETLNDIGWKGRKQDDRLVIFAERIDTLDYLERNLITDFNLEEDKSIRRFDGGLADTEQQEVVEDFGREDSYCRLLLCSDAGSQGVNLHYFCHRMFNFDIPWSLITLEQRNGRIDRYGQQQTPYIHYLIASSDTPGLKTDLHIIDALTQKEEEVYRTLGDAGSVMKLYDAQREEDQVVQAILVGTNSPFADADEAIAGFEFSFLNDDDTTPAIISADPYEKLPSFYLADADYYKDLFEQLVSAGQMDAEEVNSVQPGYIELLNTPELSEVLYDIPAEAKPRIGQLYRLSLDKDTVQAAIAGARRGDTGQWSAMQVLYELHPAIRYSMNKLEASIPKNHAPVARTSRVPHGTAWYVIHGQVSNAAGQPVVSRLMATPVKEDGSGGGKTIPLEEFILRYSLNETMHTAVIQPEVVQQLQQILPDAIAWAESYMLNHQMELEARMEKQLQEYEQKLQNWKQESLQQLELDFSDKTITHFWKSRKETRQQEIQTIAHNSSVYYQNFMRLRDEEALYLKVLAVFYNF